MNVFNNTSHRFDYVIILGSGSDSHWLPIAYRNNWNNKGPPGTPPQPHPTPQKTPKNNNLSSLLNYSIVGALNDLQVARLVYVHVTQEGMTAM